MKTYQSFLQKATMAYQAGLLFEAKDAVNTAHQQMLAELGADAAAIPSMDLLNILSLKQSIALRENNFTAFAAIEDDVKNNILALLGEHASSYYAMHLLDACEGYCNYGDAATAQWYLEEAYGILTASHHPCILLDFLYAYYNAKILFQLEQYHRCIDECLSANELWLAEDRLPADADDFLIMVDQNHAQMEKMEFSTLLLLGCCYGKINNLSDGIFLLTQLSEDRPADFYLEASLDLCLAELYAKNNDYAQARCLYEKYRNANFIQYPNLTSALASLSFLLGPDAQMISAALFSGVDGELPTSLYYGKDAVQTQLYNLGISMTAAGKYTEALSLFSRLGNKGLSMCIYLNALTGNYAAIPALKEQADSYFEREIRNLFLYYDEKLVCNHLSLLEYHFSLCMYAYINCHNVLGEKALPAQCIYEFLLNTKYISMEASWLSRQYQSLESLKIPVFHRAECVCNALPKDTVLLEFCQYRTLEEVHYAVFFVDREQILCLSLGPAVPLDSLVLDWQKNLLDVSSSFSQQSLARTKDLDSRLRRLLFRPIRDFFSAKPYKNLMIAPAGALSLFSFHLLSVSSQRYLGDDYRITYLNTGKELLYPSCDTIHGFDSRPLVIGNPKTIHFAPLPFAEKEAHLAAACLHTTAYTKDAANLSCFSFSAENAPTLIHIATHGIYQKPSCDCDSMNWNMASYTMEHSGLILSDDTLLSCRMISTLPLSATRIAILSACDTGAGLFSNAEGYYGLRRAFKLAGCQSFIVTLWPVEDRSCYLFMEDFYHTLTQSSCSPLTSFRHAVDAVRNYEENGRFPFSHPYYWAGYVFQS